jgi:hypothetical protein
MLASKMLFVVLFVSSTAFRAAAQSTSQLTCETGNYGWGGDASISADGQVIAYDDLHVTQNFPPAGAYRVLVGGQQAAFVDYAHDDFTAWFTTLSADGQTAIFTDPTARVPADTNGYWVTDVYAYQSGAIELISQGPTGTCGNSYSSTPGGVSANGRFVVFTSYSTNLIAGGTNGQVQVYLRDRTTQTTEIVSVSTSGAQGNGLSQHAVVSDDGRFVAFESSATNLVAGDSSGFIDIFLRDRQLGVTTRVSLDSNGVEANQQSTDPAMSGDGRFIAFQSRASNLVPADTNGVEDVFVRDTLAGVTRRVSLSSSAEQANAACTGASISGEGRFVTFDSAATNLAPGVRSGHHDVFLRDRESSRTELISVGADGQDLDYGGYWGAKISAGGRFVVFNGSNPGCAFDTPQTNVFLRDRGAPGSVQANCIGHGGPAACPCGDVGAGQTAAGCPNSFGMGAELTASGTASLSNDTFHLLGAHMPDSTCLFLQSTDSIRTVMGDGLRCVGGTVSRLGAAAISSGQSAYPLGAQLPVHLRGNVAATGTRWYQVWYRNSASFCTSATFNWSNSLSVVWGS